MSLRARLLLVVLLTAAATLLPLGVVLRASLDRYAQDQAQRSALGQLSLIAGEGGSGLSVDDRLGVLYAQLSRAALDRGSWGVLITGGRRYDTDTAPHPGIPPQALADVRRRGQARAGDLLLVRSPGGTILGLNLQQDDIRALLARFTLNYLLAAALALLATALLGAWLLGVGLSPLRAMSRRAERLTAAQLDVRLDVPPSHDEVSALARSLNLMLDRLQDAFTRLTAEEARTRRFAADASHELRTPLAAIQGSLEVLERSAGNEEARERLLANLRRESRRAGRLVDDLLTLTRLDAGEPLQREALDLRALLAGVLDSARDLAPDRHFALEGPGVTVRADRARVEGAVWNLIRNAAAHTPPGGHITLRVQSGPPVTVSVLNPATLPEAFLTRMFERFVRGPEATRTPGGSGLGLAIVQATARAHGGDANARNTPEGLEVRLTLPAD